MNFMRSCASFTLAASFLASSAHATLQLPTGSNPLLDTSTGLQWIKTYDTAGSSASGFRTATTQEFAALMFQYGMSVTSLNTSPWANEYTVTGKDIRELGFTADLQRMAAPLGIHVAQGVGLLDDQGNSAIGGIDTYAVPIPCEGGGFACWSGTDYTSRALLADIHYFDDKSLSVTYPYGPDPKWAGVYGYAVGNASLGTYMVRAVPEPTTASLYAIALALTGVASIMKKRKG